MVSADDVSLIDCSNTYSQCPWSERNMKVNVIVATLRRAEEFPLEQPFLLSTKHLAQHGT